MADRIQEYLRTLATWDEAAPDAAGLALIRRGLRREPGLVVERCAHLVARHRLVALADELVAAWDRLLQRPVKVDPRCRGKTAVVAALHELAIEADSIFVAAVAHVQVEPVFGGAVDTAGELRGTAALALVARHHGDALRHLADLLADPVATARRHAARILAGLGDERAELLLRLRVRAGEADPELWGDYFGALLEIDGDRYLPVVAGFLATGDAAVRMEAAFALGNSRRVEALPLLAAAREGTLDARERLLLLGPVAHLRLPEAFAWLVDRAADGSAEEAREVITLLAPYRDRDPWQHLREVLATRPDARDLLSLMDGD